MILENVQVVKFDTLTLNERIYSSDCILNLSEIEKAVEDKRLYGTFHDYEQFRTELYDSYISMSHASHIITSIRLTHNQKTVNLLKKVGIKPIGEAKWDVLSVDIKILETTQGKVLKAILEAMPDSIVFRPCGYGVVSRGGIIKNYHLHTINAIPKKYDTFNGVI